MMLTVWKYRLDGPAEKEFMLPSGSKVLSVGFQTGVPVMWVLCSDKARLVPRNVVVLGTGWCADHVVNFEFVGTMREGLHLVWHVFIEPEEKEIL